MDQSLAIAHEYFEASNKSDFAAITELISPTLTYSSATTGLFVGADAVLEMQRAFHSSFASLHWTINSIEEIKPNIVLVDYSFSGSRPNGDVVSSDGLEYILIAQATIQHIEIRPKL